MGNPFVISPGLSGGIYLLTLLVDFPELQPAKSCSHFFFLFFCYSSSGTNSALGHPEIVSHSKSNWNELVNKA